MKLLKYSVFSLGVALITACASDAEMDATSQKALAAFESICEQALGDVEQVRALALSQGFEEQATFAPLATNGGGLFHSVTEDNFAVQANIATVHEFECAVTIDDVANPSALRTAFYALSNGEQTKVVDGQTYNYLFDTEGGEALVVFSN